MPGLILRDPLVDLLARDVARRWQGPRLAVQPRREEKQEFLLLLRRQRVSGLFNFSQRAHARRMPHPPSRVNRARRYEGTFVFISHDVYFIRKLATKVLHVTGGKVMPYPGGYDYFLEKTGALADERAALTAG